MVAGGDTLFFDDFSLPHVMKTFDERKDGASLVLWYESVDTRKTGILLTDSKGLVNGYVRTKTELATICIAQ